METVEIRKIKRPGAVATWSGYVVGDDEFGLWVFSPKESKVVAVLDGVATETRIGGGETNGVLCLVQPQAWWFAAWWEPVERGRLLGTDACTPPKLIDGRWTWIDLELDVVRGNDGTVWVEDEDEFEEAIGGGYINADEQREAIAITADLQRWLRGAEAPFDDAAWRRFSGAQSLGLDPLAAPLV